MCTVTAVPRLRLSSPQSSADPLLLRVVCNRDERRTRPEGLPPLVHTVEGRRVLMPLDPESGGTWIAVNDNGLVFLILNVTPLRFARGDGLSRGGLIPRVAPAATTSEAVARLAEAEAWRYRPFRLLMLDASQFVECWTEDGRLRHRRAYLQDAVMRTSSSLGDARVDAPRRTLFRRFFGAATHAATAQDMFHDHQWTGREDISVRMQRTDALTVSRTTLEVSRSFAIMAYRATRSGLQTRAALPLAPPAARLHAQCS
jgi:hypothetical protein